MNMPGIETVSHLATHFFMSQRHGRDPLKKRIHELNLQDYVPDKLYKGFYKQSRKPWQYPTKQFEKQQGPKPLTCERCGFQAKDSKQMKIHHMTTAAKNTREYVTSKDLKVLCANCHSLEHRTGDHLKVECGQWRKNPPNYVSYSNPDDIFSDDCPFDFRVQKNYYIKWHLKSADEYKCKKCGADYWGPNQQLLVLELNHIDGTRKNSSLDNLELLCPNCHRLLHTTAKKGQPEANTPKPPKRRVFIKVPDINPTINQDISPDTPQDSSPDTHTA